MIHRRSPCSASWPSLDECAAPTYHQAHNLVERLLTLTLTLTLTPTLTQAHNLVERAALRVATVCLGAHDRLALESTRPPRRC
mgnify:CR=1 FL=1